MRPLQVGVDGAQEVVVEDVGEGAVAEVVAETRDGNIGDVAWVDVKGGSMLLLQLFHQLAGKIASADGMLEPVVAGSREDIVDAPQLLEWPQPLELLSINDVPAINKCV